MKVTVAITSSARVVAVNIMSDLAEAFIRDVRAMIEPTTTAALAWWRLPAVRFPRVLGEGEVILASRKRTVPQLRAELGSIIAPSEQQRTADGTPPPQASPPSTSPADRLRQLQALRDEGLVSDEELEAKRGATLEEL